MKTQPNELTKTQMRVAVAYAEGYIGKEIADKLCISYNTVVRHTQDIYERLDLKHSTNAIAAWAVAKVYDVDLKELARRAGAGVLLLIFCVGTFNDNSAVRRFAPRRVQSQRRASSRRGHDDGDVDYTDYQLS